MKMYDPWLRSATERRPSDRGCKCYLQKGEEKRQFLSVNSSSQSGDSRRNTGEGGRHAVAMEAWRLLIAFTLPSFH